MEPRGFTKPDIFTEDSEGGYIEPIQNNVLEEDTHQDDNAVSENDSSEVESDEEGDEYEYDEQVGAPTKELDLVMNAMLDGEHALGKRETRREDVELIDQVEADRNDTEQQDAGEAHVEDIGDPEDLLNALRDLGVGDGEPVDKSDGLVTPVELDKVKWELSDDPYISKIQRVSMLYAETIDKLNKLITEKNKYYIYKQNTRILEVVNILMNIINGINNKQWTKHATEKLNKDSNSSSVTKLVSNITEDKFNEYYIVLDNIIRKILNKVKTTKVIEIASDKEIKKELVAILKNMSFKYPFPNCDDIEFRTNLQRDGFKARVIIDLRGLADREATDEQVKKYLQKSIKEYIVYGYNEYKNAIIAEWRERDYIRSHPAPFTGPTPIVGQGIDGEYIAEHLGKECNYFTTYTLDRIFDRLEIAKLNGRDSIFNNLNMEKDVYYDMFLLYVDGITEDSIARDFQTNYKRLIDTNDLELYDFIDPKVVKEKENMSEAFYTPDYDPDYIFNRNPKNQEQYKHNHVTFFDRLIRKLIGMYEEKYITKDNIVSVIETSRHSTGNYLIDEDYTVIVNLDTFQKYTKKDTEALIEYVIANGRLNYYGRKYPQSVLYDDFSNMQYIDLITKYGKYLGETASEKPARKIVFDYNMYDYMIMKKEILNELSSNGVSIKTPIVDSNYEMSMQRLMFLLKKNGTNVTNQFLNCAYKKVFDKNVSVSDTIVSFYNKSFKLSTDYNINYDPEITRRDRELFERTIYRGRMFTSTGIDMGQKLMDKPKDAVIARPRGREAVSKMVGKTAMITTAIFNKDWAGGRGATFNWKDIDPSVTRRWTIYVNADRSKNATERDGKYGDRKVPKYTYDFKEYLDHRLTIEKNPSTIKAIADYLKVPVPYRPVENDAGVIVLDEYANMLLTTIGEQLIIKMRLDRDIVMVMIKEGIAKCRVKDLGKVYRSLWMRNIDGVTIFDTHFKNIFPSYTTPITDKANDIQSRAASSYSQDNKGNLLIDTIVEEFVPNSVMNILNANDLENSEFMTETVGKSAIARLKADDVTDPAEILHNMGLLKNNYHKIDKVREVVKMNKEFLSRFKWYVQRPWKETGISILQELVGVDSNNIDSSRNINITNEAIAEYIDSLTDDTRVKVIISDLRNMDRDIEFEHADRMREINYYLTIGSYIKKELETHYNQMKDPKFFSGVHNIIAMPKDATKPKWKKYSGENNYDNSWQAFIITDIFAKYEYLLYANMSNIKYDKLTIIIENMMANNEEDVYNKHIKEYFRSPSMAISNAYSLFIVDRIIGKFIDLSIDISSRDRIEEIVKDTIKNINNQTDSTDRPVDPTDIIPFRPISNHWIETPIYIRGPVPLTNEQKFEIYKTNMTKPEHDYAIQLRANDLKSALEHFMRRGATKDEFNAYVKYRIEKYGRFIDTGSSVYDIPVFDKDYIKTEGYIPESRYKVRFTQGDNKYLLFQSSGPHMVLNAPFGNPIYHRFRDFEGRLQSGISIIAGFFYLDYSPEDKKVYKIKLPVEPARTKEELAKIYRRYRLINFKEYVNNLPVYTIKDEGKFFKGSKRENSIVKELNKHVFQLKPDDEDLITRIRMYLNDRSPNPSYILTESEVSRLAQLYNYITWNIDDAAFDIKGAYYAFRVFDRLYLKHIANIDRFIRYVEVNSNNRKFHVDTVIKRATAILLDKEFPGKMWNDIATIAAVAYTEYQTLHEERNAIEVGIANDTMRRGEVEYRQMVYRLEHAKLTQEIGDSIITINYIPFLRHMCHTILNDLLPRIRRVSDVFELEKPVTVVNKDIMQARKFIEIDNVKYPVYVSKLYKYRIPHSFENNHVVYNVRRVWKGDDYILDIYRNFINVPETVGIEVLNDNIILDYKLDTIDDFLDAYQKGMFPIKFREVKNSKESGLELTKTSSYYIIRSYQYRNKMYKYHIGVDNPKTEVGYFMTNLYPIIPQPTIVSNLVIPAKLTGVKEQQRQIFVTKYKKKDLITMGDKIMKESYVENSRNENKFKIKWFGVKQDQLWTRTSDGWSPGEYTITPDMTIQQEVEVFNSIPPMDVYFMIRDGVKREYTNRLMVDMDELYGVKLTESGKHNLKVFVNISGIKNYERYMRFHWARIQEKNDEKVRGVRLEKAQKVIQGMEVTAYRMTQLEEAVKEERGKLLELKVLHKYVAEFYTDGIFNTNEGEILVYSKLPLITKCRIGGVGSVEGKWFDNNTKNNDVIINMATATLNDMSNPNVTREREEMDRMTGGNPALVTEFKLLYLFVSEFEMENTDVTIVEKGNYLVYKGAFEIDIYNQALLWKPKSGINAKYVKLLDAYNKAKKEMTENMNRIAAINGIESDVYNNGMQEMSRRLLLAQQYLKKMSIVANSESVKFEGTRFWTGTGGPQGRGLEIEDIKLEQEFFNPSMSRAKSAEITEKTKSDNIDKKYVEDMLSNGIITISEKLKKLCAGRPILGGLLEGVPEVYENVNTSGYLSWNALFNYYRIEFEEQDAYSPFSGDPSKDWTNMSTEKFNEMKSRYDVDTEMKEYPTTAIHLHEVLRNMAYTSELVFTVQLGNNYNPELAKRVHNEVAGWVTDIGNFEKFYRNDRHALLPILKDTPVYEFFVNYLEKRKDDSLPTFVTKESKLTTFNFLKIYMLLKFGYYYKYETINVGKRREVKLVKKSNHESIMEFYTFDPTQTDDNVEPFLISSVRRNILDNYNIWRGDFPLFTKPLINSILTNLASGVYTHQPRIDLTPVFPLSIPTNASPLVSVSDTWHQYSIREFFPYSQDFSRADRTPVKIHYVFTTLGMFTIINMEKTNPQMVFADVNKYIDSIIDNYVGYRRQFVKAATIDQPIQKRRRSKLASVTDAPIVQTGVHVNTIIDTWKVYDFLNVVNGREVFDVDKLTYAAVELIRNILNKANKDVKFSYVPWSDNVNKNKYIVESGMFSVTIPISPYDILAYMGDSYLQNVEYKYGTHTKQTINKYSELEEKKKKMSDFKKAELEILHQHLVPFNSTNISTKSNERNLDTEKSYFSKRHLDENPGIPNYFTNTDSSDYTIHVVNDNLRDPKAISNHKARRLMLMYNMEPIPPFFGYNMNDRDYGIVNFITDKYELLKGQAAINASLSKGVGQGRHAINDINISNYIAYNGKSFPRIDKEMKNKLENKIVALYNSKIRKQLSIYVNFLFVKNLNRLQIRSMNREAAAKIMNTQIKKAIKTMANIDNKLTNLYIMVYRNQFKYINYMFLSNVVTKNQIDEYVKKLSIYPLNTDRDEIEYVMDATGNVTTKINIGKTKFNVDYPKLEDTMKPSYQLCIEKGYVTPQNEEMLKCQVTSRLDQLNDTINGLLSDSDRAMLGNRSMVDMLLRDEVRPIYI